MMNKSDIKLLNKTCNYQVKNRAKIDHFWDNSNLKYGVVKLCCDL